MLFHSPCDFQRDPGEDDFVIFDQSATATIYIYEYSYLRKDSCEDKTLYYGEYI